MPLDYKTSYKSKVKRKRRITTGIIILVLLLATGLILYIRQRSAQTSTDGAGWKNYFQSLELGNPDAGKPSCSQIGLYRFQQRRLIIRLYCGKAAAEKGDFCVFQRCLALQHFPAGLCDFLRRRGLHRSADGALIAKAALMGTPPVGNEKGKGFMLCHSP